MHWTGTRSRHAVPGLYWSADQSAGPVSKAGAIEEGSAVSTGGEWPAEIPVRLAYSVEEAAALLGIGRTFMFQLVATGEIESFKIGNLRKISHEALVAYIDRLRSEQAAAVSRWGKARGSGQQDGSQASN
jgi:excisionase family DNA binding protein